MARLSKVPPTVIHLTHQKAGSQWIYQVLDALFPHLIVYPQAWSGQFLSAPIQQGRVYPTVYLSRGDYNTVQVPAHHRKFLVMRDLRDTLVSLYFSVRFSHPTFLSDRIGPLRDQLSSMSEEEGMECLLDVSLPYAAAIQLSWLGGDVPVYRYEDALKDPMTFFSSVLDYCELKVSQSMLRNVVEAMSFRKRSGREPGTEDRSSHYRRGVAGDWRNHLKGDLLEKFYIKLGRALVETGYETPASIPLPLEQLASREEILQSPQPIMFAPEVVNRHRKADSAQLHRQWELSGPARPESALQQDQLICGIGWYPVEEYEGQRFSWVADEAQLTVRRPSGKFLCLTLDLELGPAATEHPLLLQVLDEEDNPITQAKISSRQTLNLDLSALARRLDTDWRLTLLAHGGGKPVEGDARTLCYRVFQLGWAPTTTPSGHVWEDLEHQA